MGSTFFTIALCLIYLVFLAAGFFAFGAASSAFSAGAAFLGAAFFTGAFSAGAFSSRGFSSSLMMLLRIRVTSRLSSLISFAWLRMVVISVFYFSFLIESGYCSSTRTMKSDNTFM